MRKFASLYLTKVGYLIALTLEKSIVLFEKTYVGVGSLKIYVVFFIYLKQLYIEG